MKHTLVILAGGVSSRMRKTSVAQLSEVQTQHANSRSKALIYLENRPMLDYILYNAKKAGITKVVIVTGLENELFKEHYGSAFRDNQFKGLSVSYAIQYIPVHREKPFGTADAVLQALQQFPELQETSFLVCNCDNLYSAKAFHALVQNEDANAMINYDRDALLFSEERIAGFALTAITENQFLKQIIEKPSPAEMASYKNYDGTYRVSMNIWKFNGAQFNKYLEQCEVNPLRDEKELPTAILRMIQDDAKAMKAIPFSEPVPDLTGRDDIKKVQDFIVSHYANFNWDVQ